MMSGRREMMNGLAWRHSIGLSRRVSRPSCCAYVQHALPEIVAPLQHPERPVQVEVGGDGGGAAVEVVVVDVAAAVVGAEVAEDDRPALVEQV
jgi:hypothetical protein